MTNNYEIRRAIVDDVDSIYNLTNSMAAQGLMLTRSKYKIVTSLSSFFVVIDSESGKVIATGSLATLWTDLCEVCALAVHPVWQGKGVGRALVEQLIEEARRLRMPQVITLTYQVEFFKKLGFEVRDKNEFPRKLWRECLECPKLENCDETAMVISI
ncbi:MAG: N-acetyltransferase [Spirochaetales bacterium]|uniref:N-acetyltransferase n=1 Tax=Candidatus Thalassospirochaeta sargassi TaxID=3119039 RepID=A0AAJ1IHK6_9SPIO|nr:N-acetyltransferase [Spirochaetales bacterium]